MENYSNETFFDIKAAERYVKKAQEYISKQAIPQAIAAYQTAAKYYHAVSDAVSENTYDWYQKAVDCENKIEDLKNGIIPKTIIEKKPAPAESKTEAKAPASDAPAAPKIGDEMPAWDPGAYSLNITKPNKSVSFDDIVGLEDAKNAVYDQLILPMKHPEIFKSYGLVIGGSMCLYGPPGTGKTTFAKAVACELGCPFIEVSCAGIVNCLIGETAKNIEKLFKEVRRFVSEQKVPVVLFLDEFDSITKSSGEQNKTADEAVPELKKQLDGFDTNTENIFVIAATNYYDSIEIGIKSRFVPVEVPLPETEARRLIFKKQCEKNMKEEDVALLDMTLLAEESNGLSGRDIKTITTKFFIQLAKRDSKEAVFEESFMEYLLAQVRNIKNQGKQHV